MGEQKNNAYTKKQLIHLAISFFFIFIFGAFCPTWGGITRPGVQAIGIFIGGIWLIANRFGMIIPSFIIMFAMLLTGFTDGTAIIQTTLGSPTVWQLIIIFVLLFALTESGADSVLARWMISRKALNGRPVLFTCVFMIAVTTLGALASAIGAFLFSVAMVNSIAESVGYDNNSQWKKAMTTGALIASSVGGGILPFKGMAMMIYNLLAPGLLEAGVEIDQISYLVAATVSGLFISVSFGLCLKPLFRVDFSKMKDADVASICAHGGTSFNKRQAVTFFIFLVGIAYSIVCTNVFSNTATAVIIGTVVGPFLIKYATTIGINPSCIIPAIVMSALCAFLTMAAGGSAPLYLGSDCMKDDPKWVWSYGLLIFPIVTITSSVAYILCAYLL